MSKRLQIVLTDVEQAEIESAAREAGQTVSDWVRGAIRHRREMRSTSNPQSKLAVLRQAAKCEFPTADIDTMLSEIESGYR